ncbi:UNKNOWN [Stylonychia lemnae]|uniref:N-acetyltransferase domain-containing protein n=1 Tax=Stylonychia lemnae TaxID=5949 RepID=A0A078B251_STYLE|nr:UNKNOWN [Stylonychia lemnae]|eukprot:CDW88569.1 UNKNOWN [Stylonychia lemnae]
MRQFRKEFLSKTGEKYVLKQIDNIKHSELAMRMRAKALKDNEFYATDKWNYKNIGEQMKNCSRILVMGAMYGIYNEKREVISTISHHNALLRFMNDYQHLAPSTIYISDLFRDTLKQLPQDQLNGGKNYAYSCLGATKPEARQNGLMKKLMYLQFQHCYELDGYQNLLMFCTAYETYKVMSDIGAKPVKFYDLPEHLKLDCYKGDGIMQPGQGVCAAMCLELKDIQQKAIEYNNSY